MQKGWFRHRPARNGSRPAYDGAPVISDLTPTESVTLTAIVSGIADSDGLTGGNFTYQWRMSTGGAFTNIAGATAATYTPGQNMIGRTLQVVVTVTDDEGNPSVVLTSGNTAYRRYGCRQ